MSNNNAGTARFLMLTLGFTAAFMHVFGVALLKWQISHSSLNAFTLALSSASLSWAEGLNTVLYTVTCLAIGAFSRGSLALFCRPASTRGISFRAKNVMPTAPT